MLTMKLPEKKKQRQLRFMDVQKSWCDKGKCQGEMEADELL